uniref:Uncharacterized protein n=1 Tax=Prolemur simus TaxID=1328070 RepID=A0A8C8YFL2_PROSS
MSAADQAAGGAAGHAEGQDGLGAREPVGNQESWKGWPGDMGQCAGRQPEGPEKGEQTGGRGSWPWVARGTACGKAGKVGIRWCLNLISTGIFTMPFSSPMVRRSLATHAQPVRGAVPKELAVSGDILTIRLTAEDPGQLQISIPSCLDQLYVLVQTLQPPSFTKPQPAKGS